MAAKRPMPETHTAEITRSPGSQNLVISAVCASGGADGASATHGPRRSSYALPRRNARHTAPITKPFDDNKFTSRRLGASHVSHSRPHREARHEARFSDRNTQHISTRSHGRRA